ncbi:MAG: hypothetical protein AVDCRST_MAG33-575, partial [uncultured Thermomicrobiales bacterium]
WPAGVAESPSRRVAESPSRSNSRSGRWLVAKRSAVLPD